MSNYGYGATYEPWPGFPACPCGCGLEGLKLQARHDKHLVGCLCRPCLGRRSKRKGREAQARGYRTLGGSAPFTPGHEENAGTHSVEVQVEAKSGAQIPSSLLKFARGEWARRAWSQAQRAIPAGVQAHPSIYVEREGWHLLVTLIKAGKS